MPKYQRRFVYAVRRGRRTGIFFSWEECQQQVNGYPRASFKKFRTRTDAEEFLKQQQQEKEEWKEHDLDSNLLQARPIPTPMMTASSMTASSSSTIDTITTSTNTRTSTPSVTNDSLMTESTPVIVFTDGAARGNGRPDATAGIGVYFGPEDPRNLSEPLPGPRQTNQRAELYAAIRALQTVDKDSPVILYSDSHYVVKGMTMWMRKWVEANWQVNIQNLDLFQQLHHLLEARPKSASVTVYYSPAHSGIHGNEMADQLAVQGAIANLKYNQYFDQ